MPRSPATPAATIPPLHRVPTYLVRRLHQICVALNHEATAAFGFTGHVGALMEIRHSPGIDQKRLAAALGADERSTGQWVAELEAQGIVERRLAPGDRRARALSLTPAGAALLERCLPTLHAVQARILSPLSPAEAGTFLALLTRLVEAHAAHARPGAGRRKPRRRPGTAPERTGGVPWPSPPPSQGEPPSA